VNERAWVSVAGDPIEFASFEVLAVDINSTGPRSIIVLSQAEWAGPLSRLSGLQTFRRVALTTEQQVKLKEQSKSIDRRYLFSRTLDLLALGQEASLKAQWSRRHANKRVRDLLGYRTCDHQLNT